MARILNAHLDPARLPDRAGLQTAIRALRFKLDLDEGFALPDPPGYLPCTLEGEDAGVYLKFDASATVPEALAAEQGNRSAMLQLRWGGDAREQLAALVVAAALAEGYGALLMEPDSATVPATADLVKQAKKLHAENF